MDEEVLVVLRVEDGVCSFFSIKLDDSMATVHNDSTQQQQGLVDGLVTLVVDGSMDDGVGMTLV